MASHSAPTPIRGDLDEEYFDEDDDDRAFDDEFEDNYDDELDDHDDNDHDDRGQSERSNDLPEVAARPKRRVFRWAARLLSLAVLAVVGVGAYLLWPTLNGASFNRSRQRLLSSTPSREESISSTRHPRILLLSLENSTLASARSRPPNRMSRTVSMRSTRPSENSTD